MSIQVIIVNNRPAGVYEFLRGETGAQGVQGEQGLPGSSVNIQEHLDAFNHSLLHSHSNRLVLNSIQETDLVPYHLEEYDHAQIHAHNNFDLLEDLSITPAGKLAYNGSSVVYDLPVVTVLWAQGTGTPLAPIAIGACQSGEAMYVFENPITLFDQVMPIISGDWHLDLGFAAFGATHAKYETYIDDVFWEDIITGYDGNSHSLGHLPSGTPKVTVKLKALYYIYGNMVYIRQVVVGTDT